MRIYISPSDQKGNHGVGIYGTEADRMQQLSDLVVPMLKASGHTVFGGTNSLTLSQRIADSNAANVDLHVALHSNASTGQTRGPETHHYPSSMKGKSLATAILYNLKSIPGSATGRSVVASNFADLRDTKAISCLIEAAFHDNQADVEWMLTNWSSIAKAICLGIDTFSQK